MTDLVLTDAYVSIDGNDLSSYGVNVTISAEAELQDGTRFGDSTRRNVPGLKNWEISLEFIGDFDAAALDSILYPLWGTAVEFEVRPTSSAVGAGNPKYYGDAILDNYSPLGQPVGELVKITATLKPGVKAAGNNSPDLQRATS